LAFPAQSLAGVCLHGRLNLEGRSILDQWKVDRGLARASPCAAVAAATPRNCDLSHQGALSFRIIHAHVLVAELRGITDHKIANMIARGLFSSGKQSIRSSAIKDLRHRNTSRAAKVSTSASNQEKSHVD
jgi:hypothetical protein